MVTFISPRPKPFAWKAHATFQNSIINVAAEGGEPGDLAVVFATGYALTSFGTFNLSTFGFQWDKLLDEVFELGAGSGWGRHTIWYRRLTGAFYEEANLAFMLTPDASSMGAFGAVFENPDVQAHAVHLVIFEGGRRVPVPTLTAAGNIGSTGILTTSTKVFPGAALIGVTGVTPYSLSHSPSTVDASWVASPGSPVTGRQALLRMKVFGEESAPIDYTDIEVSSSETEPGRFWGAFFEA